MGDAEATEAAFARADHVTKLRLVNNRCFVSAMEPRAAVAAYDGETDRYTLYVGSQGVMGMRNILANAVLKCPPEKIRVVTGEVGGSFGMKSMPYHEYPRSEEHTSELQSLMRISYAVFCLKNKNK